MRTLFIEKLSKKIHINEGGKRRSTTKAEAAVLRAIEKALNGDPKMLALILAIDREAYPAGPQDLAPPRQELNPIEAEEMEAFFKRNRWASNSEPTDPAPDVNPPANGDPGKAKS